MPTIVRLAGHPPVVEVDMGLTMDDFGTWLTAAPADSGGPLMAMGPQAARRGIAAAVPLLDMLDA